MKVQDVYNRIDEVAPFASALPFDNAGLLVGNADAEVRGVLVALDVTDAVIDEAVSRGDNLIVTHHPVLFNPVKQLLAGHPAYRLAREDISVICAHTNMDLALGGVNDLLAGSLRLREVEQLPPDNLIRIGTLERGMTPPEFAYFVKQVLDLPAVRYSGGGRTIERVAVCGGSGGSELAAVAAAGCDALVTADVKHSQFHEATRLGVTLLDGGHFGTENPVVQVLADLAADVVGTEHVRVAASNEDPATVI